MTKALESRAQGATAPIPVATHVSLARPSLIPTDLSGVRPNDPRDETLWLGAAADDVTITSAE